MSDWFLETGLYLLGIALIPIVGVVLVCWGLWGARSKGRPRCPKCWYDMRGTVPKLVCPECGHDAGQQRGLYRSRRRWRRVVVGVALVLLFSYPLTIVGGWYREQAAIQNLRGPNSGVGKPIRVGPDWLVGRLPDSIARLFDRTVSAQHWSSPTDAELAECGKLWWLEELQVGHECPSVTDEGLAHLKGLTQLRFLHLSSTQVTDAGLVHLKGLTRLRTLCLISPQVTDASLAKLKQVLPNVDGGLLYLLPSDVAEPIGGWPPPGNP